MAADIEDNDEEETPAPAPVIGQQGIANPGAMNLQALGQFNQTQAQPQGQTLDALTDQTTDQVGQQLGSLTKTSPLGNPYMPTMPSKEVPKKNRDLGDKDKETPSGPDLSLPSPGGDYQKYIDQEITARKAAGDESAQQYKDEEAERIASDERIQNIWDTSQDKLKGFQVEQQKILNDMKTGVINPNHYLENMGVGDRITTALGMLVSGAGAGMLHQENPVTKWLDNQIERDIESQKANMDNKKTLFGAINSMMGNERDSAKFYTSLMLQQRANKLEEIVARHAGPIEQQNVAATVAQLRQKAGMITQELALNRAKNDYLFGSGRLPDSMTPEQKALYLRNTGLMKDSDFAPVMNDIETSQMAEAQRKPMLDLFDQAAKEQTALKRLGGLRGDSPAVKALVAQGRQLLHKRDGRVNNEAVEEYKKTYVPGIAQFDGTQSEMRQHFEEWLNGFQALPHAKQYKINLAPGPSQRKAAP